MVKTGTLRSNFKIKWNSVIWLGDKGILPNASNALVNKIKI